MEASFWFNKWRNREIGFHQSEANPFLVKYIQRLKLSAGDRLFLPLCGKTLDAAWLLSQGFRVVGAELSEEAVKEFFEELGVVPVVNSMGSLIHYSAGDVDMFVGDIFDLSSAQLGSVDAVYDRAALVALPEAMRTRYAQHLIELTGAARQLLITFEYDQSLMPGPPFCISHEEVSAHYNKNYRAVRLESGDVKGGLKGVCKADEVTWLLEGR